MKKVFTIFSIVLLIAAASCGGKSTEEQAMADSIAAAGAVGFTSTNGSALIESYELFKEEGYAKSFQQFKILLAQNPDALNDMYTLYSNRKGYTGDLMSYLNLIGIKPEPSPEELRTLYDVIIEAHLYTKSFEEFKTQWEEQEGYKERVFNTIILKNLYWSGRDVFFQKYSKKSPPTFNVEQKSTYPPTHSQDKINLILSLFFGFIGLGLLFVFREKVKFFRKLIVKALFSTFSMYTLFFASLCGLFIGILGGVNGKDEYPLFLIPSVFIIFILWKNNFFTKEPRNTHLDGTREKGKEMLDELRKMGPDESMVGKTVIKKASVKKEEDKNSTEE